MALPSELHQRLSERAGPIHAVTPLSGGSGGATFRVSADGRSLFVKHTPDGPPAFYDLEAIGLRALRAVARGIRVPRVIAHEDQGPTGSWIALEWLDAAPPTASAWSALGSGLAAVHKVAGAGWGWERDGYIGPLEQSNSPCPTWSEFWAESRILPQLDRALDRASVGSPAEWERLLAAVPDIVGPAESDGPSLLHGDLWSGNVLMTPHGPALIDPSVYRGHREVDLAMAELFGGFDPIFFAAYEEAWPLQPGYPLRRSVYQLYYLLVHVNLFGSSYAGSTSSTLRSVLRSL